MILGTQKPNPARSSATADIKAWTRARFRLDPEASLMVAEVACSLPNCPPLETVVAFWDKDGVRHQFKILRPLLEVGQSDIGWLVGSLKDHDAAAGWDCC